MKHLLRIGTRRSALALWQAEHISARLREVHPGLEVELVKMTTKGDQFLSAPLREVGGKGLFTREIEDLLLSGEIDLAVHSLKDLPSALPPGLVLAPPPPREDPRDALCTRNGQQLADLPQGARVGTASLRRFVQLLAARPDLRIEPIRGNVPTRLGRLDGSEPLDGVVLAAAGLRRLGLERHIGQAFSAREMVPAVGQGILGLELREGDACVAALVAPLGDAGTAVCATAERALLASLGAGCSVPMGGHAWLLGDALHLEALLGDPTTLACQRVAGCGVAADAVTLGESLGAALLAGPLRHVLQPER